MNRKEISRSMRPVGSASVLGVALARLLIAASLTALAALLTVQATDDGLSFGRVTSVVENATPGRALIELRDLAGADLSALVPPNGRPLPESGLFGVAPGMGQVRPGDLVAIAGTPTVLQDLAYLDGRAWIHLPLTGWRQAAEAAIGGFRHDLALDPRLVLAFWLILAAGCALMHRRLLILAAIASSGIVAGISAALAVIYGVLAPVLPVPATTAPVVLLVAGLVGTLAGARAILPSQDQRPLPRPVMAVLVAVPLALAVQVTLAPSLLVLVLGAMVLILLPETLSAGVSALIAALALGFGAIPAMLLFLAVLAALLAIARTTPPTMTEARWQGTHQPKGGRARGKPHSKLTPLQEEI